MKILVVIGVLVVGWYVDSQFYKGKYVGAVATLGHKIAVGFGVR